MDVRAACTRKSIVYENIFNICNKGAGGKDEVVGADPDIPSIYVGETSRTVQERGAEHWAAARGSQKAKEGSHMAKHQELCHPGVEPQFTLRAVGFHPSALSRQTAESVRIAKRGGDLVEQVERAEEEETVANLMELQDRDEKNKRDRAKIWRTLLGREQNSSAKRGSAKELTKRVKRKKLDLIGTDWGMKTTEGGTKTTVEQDKDQN